jgi:hypothetical protein
MRLPRSTTYVIFTPTPRLQRKQTVPAHQDLPGMRAAHDLAEVLGEKLGGREVLLGRLPKSWRLKGSPHAPELTRPTR